MGIENVEKIISVQWFVLTSEPYTHRHISLRHELFWFGRN